MSTLTLKLGALLQSDDSGDWGDAPSGINDLMILRSGNITDETWIDLDDTVYRAIAEPKRTKLLLRAGDILLERSGGTDTRPVGRVAFIEHDIDAGFSNFLHRLRVNRSVADPSYVRFVLTQWHRSGRAVALQTQTTGIRNLMFSRYLAEPIRVPSLDVQRRIAAILEAATASLKTVDALIAAKREQKRGLMQQLLTGKVRFPGFTEPWKTVRLGDVADVRFSNVDKHTIPGERQVRLCNYTDVFRNRFLHPDMDFMSASATAREIENFGLQVGDVAITKDSETPDEIGVPALIDRTAPDLVLGYHLALLRADRARLDPGFLLILMESDLVRAHFQRRAKGLTRFALSIGAVADTPISLPKLGEQTKIAKIYRDITMEESLLKAQRASFVTQRHGLMERLLSGDILIPSSNTSAA